MALDRNTRSKVFVNFGTRSNDIFGTRSNDIFGTRSTVLLI